LAIFQEFFSWNIVNGSLLFVGRASDKDIYSVSSVNGQIATGCREGVIRLWSWTGQQLKVKIPTYCKILTPFLRTYLFL